MFKVFIDGSAGTTGLRIFDRLSARDDIELLTISDGQRKNPAVKSELINSSDVTFLCLPDDAARESVALVKNPHTRIIDASTAHRTLPGWSYGFPELSPEHRQGVVCNNRIAVPGCHAGGFISLVYPLVKCGLLPRDYPLVCHSLTGYSGGGNKMIAQYGEKSDPLLESPRQYGLTQQHKHLKEMKEIPALEFYPIFCPIVADFYSGMETTIPLLTRLLTKGVTPSDITEIYAEHYGDSPIVRVSENASEDGFLASNRLSGSDTMEISVCGNDERILLVSRFDNLGKGASGAAIECMNLALGLDETKGLNI